MSILVTHAEDGRLALLTLNAGKGNILDTAVIRELQGALLSVAGDPCLRAVVLTAEGPHFSFGASVPEHRRDQVGAMLPTFHALVQTLLEYPLPLWAAVSGNCLGGGLELALATHRIFAHPGALFGQPEIKLGVFAPAGSALLAERLGQPQAERLLLTGATVNAMQAHELGLVDELCGDGELPQAAAARFAKPLLGLSSSSLRFAVRAARQGFVERALQRLRSLEQLYLSELVATPDANEGIAAFLEKRAPVWKDEGAQR